MAPVFVWKCQRAFLGRAGDVLADGSLTPMIDVTSVGTGATMPMTAIALAREVVAAGEGILSILHMVTDFFIRCVYVSFDSFT